MWMYPPKFKGEKYKDMCFPGALVVKNPPANAGDTDVGSTFGSGRSPEGGHGNPLQYSCLENPIDRGAWGGYAQGVAKFQTCLQRPSTHTRTHKKRNFPALCRVTSGGFCFLQEKLWTHLLCFEPKHSNMSWQCCIWVMTDNALQVLIPVRQAGTWNLGLFAAVLAASPWATK